MIYDGQHDIMNLDNYSCCS